MRFELSGLITSKVVESAPNTRLLEPLLRPFVVQQSKPEGPALSAQSEVVRTYNKLGLITWKSHAYITQVKYLRI